MSVRAKSTLGAIFGLRCPRCRTGHIFKSSILWFAHTNEQCPVCGLKFEREKGYFLGAMVISYATATPLLVFFMLLFWWLARWSWNAILIGVLSCCFSIPALFGCVLWLDREIDLGDESEGDLGHLD